MSSRRKMRTHKRRLCTENIGIHEVQHFASAIIIRITRRSCKMEIAHLVFLKCLDDLPLVSVNDRINFTEFGFRLSLCFFQPAYNFL
ncbi:hypothetical protein D3C81_1340030 [compost metagenome]